MAGRRREHWFLGYTAMFVICMLCYAAVLAIHGRTPILGSDGYWQHYTVLGYISKTVRGLLKGEGLRMVNFSLGQGMDVMTTLSYYGYTDPLNLLAALFTQETMVCGYVLIDVVRAYLVGLCFIAYARAAGARNGWALSCAAIILVFDGYNIYNLTRHTYFLNASMYLSLLLMGIERLLKDRRWVGYTLVTALMLVVNFYFAFMNTVVAILYIVVRLIARVGRRGLKGTAADGFALLGGYLLGMMLAAVVFLPVVIVFLGNARLNEVSGYAGSMLHYPMHFYRSLVVRAFTPAGSAGSWTVLNYAPLALIGVLTLFAMRGGRARQVRLALLLCAVGLGIPMVGRVMNGNSYVANRWSFAPGVFVALGCALSLGDFAKRQGPVRRWIIAVLTLVYFAVFAADWYLYSGRSAIQLVVPALMAAFAILYGIGVFAGSARTAQRAAALFLVLTTCVQLFASYESFGMEGSLLGYDVTDIYENETVSDRYGDGLYRVNQMGFRDPHALNKGYMGSSFYWSMVSGTLGDYYCDLGLASQNYKDCTVGLGASAAMNAVAAVKYYTLPEDWSEGVVPYGFEPMETAVTGDGSRFEVYVNPEALPLGYAYDTALSEAEYAALPVEQKLMALTHCAVCDSQSVPRAEIPDGAIALDLKIEPGEGVELGDGGASFEAQGSLNLTFDAPEGAEAWLMIDEMAASADGVFIARSRLGDAVGLIKTSGNNFYFHRPVTALCLGGDGEAVSNCTFTSIGQADYSWEDFRAVALPIDQYRADMEARRREALEDIELGVNRITGRITVEGSRVLQIAMLYSRGWTAKVDGKPARLFKCGGMYMGVELEAGTHEIELGYVTPGLRVGAGISAAALVALAVITARRRRLEPDREDAGTRV